MTTKSSTSGKSNAYNSSNKKTNNNLDNRFNNSKGNNTSNILEEPTPYTYNSKQSINNNYHKERVNESKDQFDSLASTKEDTSVSTNELGNKDALISDPPYDKELQSANDSERPDNKENNNGNETSYNNSSKELPGVNSPSNSQSKGDFEADMTFTEEEIYGTNSDRDSDRDELYTQEGGNHTNATNSGNTSGELPAITSSQISNVRQRLHIPPSGFLVTTRRGEIRKNINVSALNQLINQLNDVEVVTHIRESIRLFTEDSDPRSVQNSIDIALVLAIAIKESGVRTLVSRSNRRIVTAGRDVHSAGKSGLDWVYDYRRYFPSNIRNHVQRVIGNSNIRGEFVNPDRMQNPAYLPEKYLLCAFIVEIRQRYRRFLRRFHRHEFVNGFTEEQRESLLQTMNTDAKRAWTQAAFGSKIRELLLANKNLIQLAIQNGASFTDIVNNDTVNLNAIITNDTILPQNLSRQRTRISAAEASLLDNITRTLFN